MPIKPFQMFSITCDQKGCAESLEVHPVDLDDETIADARQFAEEHEGWAFRGRQSLCPKHCASKIKARS